METIAKLLKAIFFDGDDVNETMVGKFKTAVLWMLIGAALTIGAILYIIDEEPAMYETDVVANSQDYAQ